MQTGGFADNALATLLAAVLGAMIGAEREWRRHPGGLRSCALVCAAASVFARIAVSFAAGSQGAALGAVASGVGFLGAGVILHAGATVRGLSTAATFWAVAAVGEASGLGAYGMAIALSVLVVSTHLLLRPLSRWIDQRAPPGEDRPA